MAKQIPLSRGMSALVDDEDFERLSKHKWWALDGRGRFYAARGGGVGKTILMHREVCPTTQEVDHADGDSLNNTRANLRPCTHSQNCANRRRKNLSGFKGVTRRKSGKFLAQIADPKNRHLGLFVTAVEAARVYDAAAKQAFGEFAVLNGV